ncbi:sugar ABC transporter substrate-binding protein [Domibacillus indicus]|uniref:sugar ABC transporter substrate-binding protein n=1 Tax=Domibacillus indicus TaxID=1437523 RepID=UPI00203B9237|nr:sugar ABC transporter substrate-binding protein [Domibacillus indicus]MCM3791340.1 sugar ABC transporter substrate-binding protein [Domibacillus indicus]
MKKIKVLSGAALSLSLLLAGCGEENSATSSQGGSDGGSEKISVILKASNEEYWKIAERGAMDAGEKYGIDVNVMAPASETQVDQQISMIQDQFTSGTSALVLAPSQPTTVLNALQQYKDSDTPVIFLDSDAEYEDKVSFVGTENFSAGKMGGEFLADKLSKGDKVAIIRGQLGSTTHDERTNGAEEALEDAGLKVATVQAADSDKDKALTVMQNILQSNPDIKAVFTTSETMALGALRAVESKNKDILVVGFDGTTEGLESIQAGGLTAEVAQDPYQMGYLSVEAAAKKLNGEEVEKRIDSGTEIVTKENVEEALAEIKKYTGK